MAKKQHYLTREERFQIEALRKVKTPVAEIARILGVCRATVYNELRRGTYLRIVDYRDVPEYSAVRGQVDHEKKNRHRGRPYKGLGDQVYMDFLVQKIRREKYSPAAALAAAETAGFSTRISVNTLYSYIDRGLLRKVCNLDLPEKVKRRVKKDRTVRRVSHPQLPSIEQRPEEINQRLVPGHWEMDLVIGRTTAGAACLMTLTERQSRRELIFKLPDKKAASVRAVFDRLEKRMGKRRFRAEFRSITTDNGSEFMEYDLLKKSIYRGDRFTVWYCHSYAAWEKGTNENTNRMIRRFFPKGTDFARVSTAQVLRVQEWLNNYPRKNLGWKTPKQIEANM